MNTKNVPRSDETGDVESMLAKQAEAVDRMMCELVGEQVWREATARVEQKISHVDCSAFDRAFQLERAHSNKLSLQQMLAIEENAVLNSVSSRPEPEKVSTINALAVKLRRTTSDYNDYLDDIDFTPDEIDASLQGYITDIAVTAIQCIDVMGKYAVEETLDKLEVSNRDVHLTLPKVPSK